MATESVNRGLAELGKVLTCFERGCSEQSAVFLATEHQARASATSRRRDASEVLPAEEEISPTDDQPGSAKPVELPTKSSVRKQAHDFDDFAIKLG